MAHFRGEVYGNRGVASRLGTKNTGLRTEAASWKGKIVTIITHNEKTGFDEYHVYQDKHEGVGIYEEISRGILGVPYATK